MNRTDTGTSTYPTRARRRLMAAAGFASVSTIRTITKSPSALTQRLKAMSGKSDQVMLTRQYKKNKRIGQLARRIAVVLAVLNSRMKMPTISIPVSRFRSNGLPSRYTSVVNCPGVDARGSHSETMRDPAMDNHTTGSHRAVDVSTVLSRFKKNRVKMPMANAKVAIFGGIFSAYSTTL